MTNLPPDQPNQSPDVSELASQADIDTLNDSVTTRGHQVLKTGRLNTDVGINNVAGDRISFGVYEHLVPTPSGDAITLQFAELTWRQAKPKTEKHGQLSVRQVDWLVRLYDPELAGLTETEYEVYDRQSLIEEGEPTPLPKRAATDPVSEPTDEELQIARSAFEYLSVHRPVEDGGEQST